VLPWQGSDLDELIVKKMSMGARRIAAKQLFEPMESLHKAGIVSRSRQDSDLNRC
jgi:hypothetical protein